MIFILKNLIVEVNSGQYYEEVHFFERTLKEEVEDNSYKETYVKEKGFNYMVVSYKGNIPELSLERFKNELNKYI